MAEKYADVAQWLERLKHRLLLFVRNNRFAIGYLIIYEGGRWVRIPSFGTKLTTVLISVIHLRFPAFLFFVVKLLGDVVELVYCSGLESRRVLTGPVSSNLTVSANFNKLYKEYQMTQTTMSVTRALAELKRIEDRLNRARTEGLFVTVTIGKGSTQKTTVNNLTPDEAKAKIQSSFDHIESLLKQRAAIKSAIVLSNAATKVTLGSQTVSVAEAIEMKKTVEQKRGILITLMHALAVANGAVSTQNAKLDADIEKHVIALYSSEKSKIDKESYELVAAPQRNQKEASLLDPANIATKIEKLRDEISLIETELDFTLSEVNAKTEITFSA